MGQKMISGQGATGEEGSGISKISKEKLKEIAESIFQTLNLSKDSRDKPLDIFITPDGVEMMIYNREQNPIFDDEHKHLSQFGDLIIRSLAWTLDQYDGNLDISIYEPELKEQAHIGDLQTQLRKEGTTLAVNDHWYNAQGLLKTVFNRLIYHGFSLHKVQTLFIEKMKPEQAQHDILMVKLSLHINTETILKR